MTSALPVIQANLQSELAQLAQAVANERISPDILYTALERTLTRAHIEAALAGRQAVDQGFFEGILSKVLDVFAPLRGGLQDKLNSELTYLRDFITQIADGNLTPAQIAARLDQYGNHVQQTFWGAQTDTQGAAGYTEERRVLNPGESCDDCIGYAGQGWQPIGSLPEPGEDSQCRANCNCSKDYR